MYIQIIATDVANIPINITIPIKGETKIKINSSTKSFRFFIFLCSITYFNIMLCASDCTTGR